MEDVQRIKNELEYPAFIKPYYGHLWREKFGGNHKGFKAHTPQELVSTYEEWDFHSNKLGLQEILDDPLIQIKKMLIMSVAFWYYAMTLFHSLIYAIYAIPLIFGFIIYCRELKINFEMRLAILGSSYFYIFCIITTAQARYSLPCIPILILTFTIVLVDAIMKMSSKTTFLRLTNNNQI
jgi:hypothetical protein